MLAVENVCRLPAPPEAVWSFYAEPRQWPLWSADIEYVEVDDDDCLPRVGTTGASKYRPLPAGRFRILTFDPLNYLVLDWETRATRIRFTRELRPIGDHGTYIRERITFHGVLAPLLGLFERRRIRTHWPRAMDSLATLALGSQPA